METTPLLHNAGDVARYRLNLYLAEKLAKLSDVSVWEFYTFLLKQARQHEPDTSYKIIYLPAFKDDQLAAKKSWENFVNNHFISLQSDNSPRGEQT